MAAWVSFAYQVLPLIEAMVGGDDDRIRECRTGIDCLEHESYEVKYTIRSRMPRCMMMAIERRDLLDILDFRIRSRM